jgi:hypothetical protein
VSLVKLIFDALQAIDHILLTGIVLAPIDFFLYLSFDCDQAAILILRVRGIKAYLDRGGNDPSKDHDQDHGVGLPHRPSFGQFFSALLQSVWRHLHYSSQSRVILPAAELFGLVDMALAQLLAQLGIPGAWRKGP